MAFGIIVLIGCAIFSLSEYKNHKAQSMENLAEIPIPIGWKVLEHTSSQLIFSKSDLGLANADPNKIYALWGTIHIDAQKVNTSVEDWLSNSNLYNSFSSSQTWNIVHGHLILSNIEPEDIYNSLSYRILYKNTMYTFWLGPYGIQPAGTKNNPINTGDVEVLQNIVSNFAKKF